MVLVLVLGLSINPLPIVLGVLEGYLRRRIKQPENEDEGRGRIFNEPIGITTPDKIMTVDFRTF